MSEKRRVASTGSHRDDEAYPAEKHEAVIKGSGEVVLVPGLTRRQRLVIDGVQYAHVGEDADKRWTFRAV